MLHRLRQSRTLYTLTTGPKFGVHFKHGAAAMEASEEAGLLGKIEKKKLGSFHYRKRLKNGAVLLCRVDVFPMRAIRQPKTGRKCISV